MNDSAMIRTSSTISMDVKGLIEAYFHMDLKYKDIVQVLDVNHGISLSLRQICRILKNHNLRRRNFTSILNAFWFISEQLRFCGQFHGYRWMHKKLLIKGIRVRKEDVRHILSILDADSVSLRRERRLNRREYFAKGPNFLWHIDGYDKLMPFGFGIHGCIDGFSRKLIWLNVYKANSDPKIIGGYYMEAIESLNGCPQFVRGDRGTENVHVMRYQTALCNTDSYLNGPSTANQRIESFWGQLRKEVAQFYLNIFHGIQDEGFFCGTFLDKNIMLFSFMHLIQDHGHGLQLRRSPENTAKEYIELNIDQDGLSIGFISDRKGYGVFAKQKFNKNDFLADYVGDLISGKEAEEREKKYARRNRRRKYQRCYTYYFKHNEKSWCIDATKTKGRVGNLVNDCITKDQCNSKMKKLIVNGRLHLVLFATKQIHTNEEILYDYGSGEDYWWRKPMMTAKCSIENTDLDASPCMDFEKPQLAQDSSPKKESTDLDASPCMDFEKPQLAQDSSPKKESTDLDASPCMDFEKPQLAQDSSPKKENTDLDASPCMDFEKPQLAQDSSPKKENTDLDASPCMDFEKPQLAQDSSPKKENTDLDASPCMDFEKPQLAQDSSPKKVHQCLSCGNAYNRKINLQRHIETCHKDSSGSSENVYLKEDSDSDYMDDFDDDTRDKDYTPDDESESSVMSDKGDIEDLVENEDFIPNSDVESDDSTISVKYPTLMSKSDSSIEKNINEIGYVSEASPKNMTDNNTVAENVTITVAASQSEGKRVWDKRNSCLFCNDLQTNLRRHLFRKHQNESEVAKVLSHPKNSREREKGLEKLRHLGNFYYNAKIRELGKGEFLVAKRPPKGKIVNYKQYVPCVYCKGYYIGSEIWRHYRDCKFSDNLTIDDDECRTIHSHGTLRASRILAEAINPDSTTEAAGQLFSSMKMDTVSEVCKKDEIISGLGFKLFKKKGLQHLNYIRAKMREIARLLMKIREHSKAGNETLKAVLQPGRFDEVIDAIMAECKYATNENNATFEIPSLALKIGHTLRKCCYMKMSKCIKDKEESGEKEAEQFIKLLSMEFTDRVSSIALQTLYTKKSQKPKCLPVTGDIVKFQMFIKEKVKYLSDKLKDNGEENLDNINSVFNELCKAALSRLITFNKRRSGEVARMRLSDFLERQRFGQQNEDVAKMLCPSEQKLVSRLELMTIGGKRGRNVPVILTQDDVTALSLLTDKGFREKAGIVNENVFVFPMARGSINNIRGCDALNSMVVEAELVVPNVFKSTNLRKYVATVSQVLNMDENELDWLANHLGHDIRVHRNYYRLQSEHVELAKIAKLLFAVDNGQAHAFAGKKLDNIQLEDLEDVMIETVDTEEEEEQDEYDKGNEFGEEESQKFAPSDPNIDTAREQDRKKVKEAKENGKHCVHKPWLAREKQFVMEQFRDAIVRGTVRGIGKRKIEEAMKKGGGVLQQRTWVQVKSCLKNIIDRNKKQSFRMEMMKIR